MAKKKYLPIFNFIIVYKLLLEKLELQNNFDPIVIHLIPINCKN